MQVVRMKVAPDTVAYADIVADRAESGNYGKVAALVGEKTHRLLFAAGWAFADENDFLVGERIRRVAHRGLDVLAREARVGVHEIRFGSTFAKFAKEQLHRYPRSTDDRFPKHHLRNDFDAIRERHVEPLIQAGYTPRRRSGYSRRRIALCRAARWHAGTPVWSSQVAAVMT